MQFAHKYGDPKRNRQKIVIADICDYFIVSSVRLSYTKKMACRAQPSPLFCRKERVRKPAHRPPGTHRCSSHTTAKYDGGAPRALGASATGAPHRSSSRPWIFSAQPEEKAGSARA
jgi:hypothetical protein